jgi:hypothetical protein
MQPAAEQATKPEFKLMRLKPFTSRINGKPPPVPYVIDGLLTEGGFSILAAKPKVGKSSISRGMAVAVAQGKPFLGRKTTRGAVMLISLEDPDYHVDNSLEALGYAPEIDAAIHVYIRLAATFEDNLRELRNELLALPDVRLVVVDTLAKLIRVQDISDFSKVMGPVDQLHNLAKEFPHIHIISMVHCKKITTDDPFDGLLGSTALRAEADTNIALFTENDRRFIVTETRIGKSLPATVILAEMVDINGSDVVQSYSLGQTLEEIKSTQAEKREAKEKLSYGDRIGEFLHGCPDMTATQAAILKGTTGKNEELLKALRSMKETGVIAVTGKKGTTSDPMKFTYNPSPHISEFHFHTQGALQ